MLALSHCLSLHRLVHPVQGVEWVHRPQTQCAWCRQHFQGDVRENQIWFFNFIDKDHCIGILSIFLYYIFLEIMRKIRYDLNMYGFITLERVKVWWERDHLDQMCGGCCWSSAQALLQPSCHFFEPLFQLLHKFASKGLHCYPSSW